MSVLKKYRIRALAFFIPVSLLVTFNNCSRVAVDVQEESSTLSFGGGDDNGNTNTVVPLGPETLASNCAEAQRLGKTRRVQLQAKFEDPGKQCDWSQSGNLSQVDTQIRARAEQMRVLSLPHAVICNVQFQSTSVSRFYYDDNVFVTLNGFVLASTSNFSQHLPSERGLYKYSWNNLINQRAQNSYADTTADKQYCAGESEGKSFCQFPATETVGAAQIQIGQSVIQTILGLTNHTQLNLGVVTTGDNDSTDCQHVPIDLNVDVEYIQN